MIVILQELSIKRELHSTVFENLITESNGFASGLGFRSIQATDAVKVSKIFIIDDREDSQVPFLRGILTRSLRNAGFSFEMAYQLVCEIREDVIDKPNLTSDELRSIVLGYLHERGYDDEARKYSDKVNKENVVWVLSSDGATVPFSKGRLAQSMDICGLDRETSYRITAGIEQRLALAGNKFTPSADIVAYTMEALTESEGDAIALRYRQWLNFSRSGRPLILLIGGTTGSGKSTISSELAHRLNIVRTQSTDMLREVMRRLLPSRLLPSLHVSSFAAFEALPHWNSDDNADSEPPVIQGYLSQAEQVGVGIEGVLSRVENEQVSLILEGIHIHPSVQEQISADSKAVVVPIILAVLKKKRLRKRLIGRGQQISSRKTERYLENFDHIWSLQSFLLSEADRFNIPIIHNESEEETVRLVMQTISEYLARDSASRARTAT